MKTYERTPIFRFFRLFSISYIHIQQAAGKSIMERCRGVYFRVHSPAFLHFQICLERPHRGIGHLLFWELQESHTLALVWY